MATDASFLTYYLNEIDHLRVAGSDLARTHKHLAGNLDFRGIETDDPQVARLIESFAFLTARLQQQFDAEFPQIPTALLETLYPQLVAPIPSMAIARFGVAPKQARAVEGVAVPRGTALYAPIEGGAECRFRTSIALPLWPIEVADVSMPSPDTLRCIEDQSDVQACVRVRLKCMGDGLTFATVKPGSLRFFIDGDRDGRFRLFELLCNNLLRIAVIRPGETEETAVYPPGLAIRQIGLDPDQAMLPYPEASHHGYRLLQEYFNYPDKFMFVELTGMTPAMMGTAPELDLLLLLDVEPVNSLRIDHRSLRMGCVPIINLFQQTSEPIRLDHLSVDYLLEPDIRAAGSTEVHSVLGVSRSAAGDRTDAIPGYFAAIAPPSQAHDDAPPRSAEKPAENRETLRWIARRKPATKPMLGGTDVELSFVDPAMNPIVPAEDVLFAQLLCTNRGLARQVTSVTGFTVESDLPIEGVSCLNRPTLPADPPVAGESLWRLVSHLSLNRLSLSDGSHNLEALRQILFLYSGIDENSRKRRQIDGIRSIATRQVVRRLGTQGWRGFVRGTEISIRFREENFVGGSAYLFGSVLDRFFALYAGVNSFTELVIYREHDDEEWKRWPARAGDRPLL